MGVLIAGERGLSLTEVLVAMAISFVLLAATLTTFDSFYRAEHKNDARNDTTEVARNALDIQARQLRNLAKRVTSPVIDSLGDYDLIFQTSDPSRTWVRYCLNTTTASATRERGRLWTAELAVPSAAVATPVTAAMRAGCPGTSWSQTRVVADYVTNRRAARERSLFEYTCLTGTTCTASAATWDQVVNVTAQLVVDTTPGTEAPELRVVSGVYLRNQNQAPVAAFVASRSSATRTVVLNASGSTDYEGRTMDFYWFSSHMPAVESIDCAHPTVTGSGSPRTLWGAAGYLGEGITLTHTFPASDGVAGTTTRNIGLVVCDPGDRHDTAGVPPDATIAVLIPV